MTQEFILSNLSILELDDYISERIEKLDSERSKDEDKKNRGLIKQLKAEAKEAIALVNNKAGFKRFNPIK